MFFKTPFKRVTAIKEINKLYCCFILLKKIEISCNTILDLFNYNLQKMNVSTKEVEKHCLGMNNVERWTNQIESNCQESIHFISTTI